MNILPSLQKLLGVSPGLTAREYRQKLQESGFVGIDKSTVNSALYSNHQLFVYRKDNNGAPRWFLKNVETDVATASVTSVSPSNKRPKKTTFKIDLYAWQEEALKEWGKNGHCGVVEAVTGAGKTHVGISAAIAEIERGGFVLVVVPSLELLRQWQKKLLTYLPKIKIGIFGGGLQVTFRECDVIIATVNAARTWDMLPRRGKGLLIADECHRYGSECNKDALDERFSRRLGLSATYQRNDNGNTEWLEPYFGETCFALNYERAISDGVICQFSVALVGAAFSESERAEYDETGEKLSKLRKKLINNFDVPEEPFGEFMKHVSVMSDGGYGEGTFIARNYLSAFKKRQKLLAESPAKLNGLVKLAGAIKSANRTLIFTETVQSAEKIAQVLSSEGIDSRAVHSSLKTDERPLILQEFGEGVFTVLVAPRILDEGVDVPEADLAIVVAASKTRRQMIQRMGRVLRRKQDGRMARFALLFIENSSEDPANGAHESFLEDILNVADSVTTFRAKDSAASIKRFLSAVV